ncbi:hypothetical protein HYDPIDRAFT_29748 [Hydnomerulius pinastri MD-312]|uniref:WW domain-containing protein n=1 Tax=Hydnomerulius pinastri MD-312 TaxID=994086 RepID=A0A0C9WE56_9AGAM|nr:hypothetical protein HYDPIDRAFT_29748 [Hydnomerulius pinastri MD-312]
MEDDTEILDWGHEEEEGVADSEQRSFAAEDDAEDAVSLGGDEEDEFLTYQSRVPQGTTQRRGHTPERSVQLTTTTTTVKAEVPKSHPDAQQRTSQQLPQERADSNPGTPQKQHKDTRKSVAPEQSPLLGRTHSFGKLTHALPPKPVVSSVPFVHPSHPSIIEATAMVSRPDRDKRNGGASKVAGIDSDDPLPPGWEVKHPRNGRGVYYYNVRTEESTWTRPASAPVREKRGQRSDPRDDPLDKSLPSRGDETVISRVGRSDGDDLSYDDRHYRPGETTGRREDRSVAPTHLIAGDTYIPDSYVPSNRHNVRSSPTPSRTRDNDIGPPPRRPVSPNGSYGDRDGTHREAPAASSLSAEDRIWVARDTVQIDHPHRERDHDSAAPSDHEQRRNPPRDTDRSSTQSAHFAPPEVEDGASRRRLAKPWESSCADSGMAPYTTAEAPLSRQKSRFPQADAAPARSDYRQSDNYEDSMRQGARTDDAYHGTDDDAPRSRPLSRDDAQKHPASSSDAQPPILTPTPTRVHAPLRISFFFTLSPTRSGSGSRKRTPLPPQSAVFRPGSRPVTSQRDNGYSASAPALPLGSPPLREPRNSNTRSAANDVQRRRTPSPPPPPTREPANHSAPTDRAGNRPHSLRSKSRANGGAQVMDSYVPQPESSRDRGDRDIVMDVDDTPPRSADPILLAPERPSHLPKRPAVDDEREAPRHPRAMDGERGGYVDREPLDLRYDDHSRSAVVRDRQWEERHAPADPTLSQRESTRRAADSRPQINAPNMRLSGTNSTPIGSRNRFSGGVPPPPVPLNGGGRRGAVMSGGNTEPVGRLNREKEYERPPHLDMLDRGAPAESGQRQDVRLSPPSNRRALPPVESGRPAGLPARPPRAVLGTSRFGPPKDGPEPMRPQRGMSPDSLRSAPYPDDTTRATPPPLSRDSSMTSIRDAIGQPSRGSHLPRRPETPPRVLHYRSEGEDQRRYRERPLSPVDHTSRRRDDLDLDPPARQRQNTPPPPSTHRRRGMDRYIPESPPTRDTYIPEPSRESFQDARGDHYVAQSTPVVQEDDRDRNAAPPMHPERAMMLQANGLPPRPPSDLGRTRSGRGSRRERREERPGINGSRRFGSSSPSGERRRYPEDGETPNRGGGGASLLDRLTLDGGGPIKSHSLADRVQLPVKRDREEMMTGDVSMEQDVEDYEGLKRPKRRGAKSRKGRR